MSSTEQFKVLSERDHVLQRPSMYVGSTSLEEVSGVFNGEWKTLKVVPALLKIINEILDNGMDEFIRTSGKFANVINVELENTVMGCRIQVTDNGRGIPIEQVDGEYRPVLAWTRARAGSNFDDDENRVTAGMNGVGSFCTNVFSTQFTGETCDGKQKLVVSCTDNAGEVKTKVSKSNRQYTKVEFYPDMSRFGDGSAAISDDHIEYIHDRLENLVICYPKLTFTFNGKKIACKNSRQIAKKYSTDFVFHDEENQKHFLFNSGDDQEFRLLSYVNGLQIKNGGVHVENFMYSLIEELRPLIKKKFKVDIKPAGIRQHFMFVSYINGFKNLKFDSQTKERITNTVGEVADVFKNINYNKMARQILANENLIDPIVQAAVAKKELADRLALARANKKNQKKRVVSHIAASSRHASEKTLFVTEGQSAIGSLLSVRDPKIHGGYPLRGKVMNTRGMKPTDVMKNKELSELMSILNLTFGDLNPDLDYGKIAIMTDADVDGGAIYCLLLNFFSNWPEVIKNNIYRVETPRYIATKGKERKFFYTDDEYMSANLKGWEVDFIKGLGSLTEDDYRKVIHEPRLTKVSVPSESELDALEMAFGNSSQSRKDWLLA